MSGDGHWFVAILQQIIVSEDQCVFFNGSNGAGW
jgi:hypothetical protein